MIAASLPHPSIFQIGARFRRLARPDAETKFQRWQGEARAITKKGNTYIRRLLVLGSTSLLRVAGKRKGALRDWIVTLRARKGARVVTVALANKLARIIWAMLANGESFRGETFAKA